LVEEYRTDKLKKLIEKGINPYPYSYDVSNHSIEIKKDYDKFENKVVSIAGRIMSFRHMGKLYFLDIQDGEGRIQMMAAPNFTDAKSLELLELLDIGDIIGIKGKVTKSNKGEISVASDEITVLSKGLLTLPEKFHGLTDIEQRYRRRYLDLISNPEVKGYLITRAKILKYMRDFLDSRGYVEFETPILQHTYGGANASPFKTHFNALNEDMFLRVADELYLKRLIVGGFDKVYEVSKDFRNEDIDSTHNPEFTQIEAYEVYKDYEDYMKMTEELLSGMVKSLFGSYKIDYQGKELDFTPPFKRVYWVKELKDKIGIDVSTLSDEEAVKIAEKEKLETSMKNAYHVSDELFDKYIKPELFNPTFVLDFPAYMSPLTKDKRGNDKLSERFELYITGKEEGNCYSELTDPIEQRKKFEDQDAERKKGDPEAPPIDEDFLEAIEYGMPPTAGIGLAIDRLAMILTNNTSIKEVIAFPEVRSEKK